MNIMSGINNVFTLLFGFDTLKIQPSSKYDMIQISTSHKQLINGGIGENACSMVVSVYSVERLHKFQIVN